MPGDMFFILLVPVDSRVGTPRYSRNGSHVLLMSYLNPDVGTRLSSRNPLNSIQACGKRQSAFQIHGLQVSVGSAIPPCLFCRARQAAPPGEKSQEAT